MADDSFLSTISQLEKENVRLQEELDRCEQQTQKESEARCHWEQRYYSLESNLGATREDLEKARQDRHRLAKKARALTKKMDASQREVSKALMTLRKVDCRVSSGQWNVGNEENIP
jgi:chromosome segregation ATPase